MAAPDGIRWVKACLSQNCVPPGALLVGFDADKEEIYAARAEHEGDIIPAKFIPAKNACYIAYDGEEVAKDQFEVLVPMELCWQEGYDGAVPPNAVKAGSAADGEVLYFGRVCQNGHLVPGKVHPSHGSCYYSFDGEERVTKEYECLVISLYFSNPSVTDAVNMRGRPYPGYGMQPPPMYGYPPTININMYPHPGYPQPGYPHPYPPHLFYPPGEPVQVVEEPSDIVPELPGETVELPWSTYKWVPACLSQNSIPPGALRVGTDVDEAEIYAGRAHHEGEIVPAKVIPSKNACYIAFNGEEILKDQFEVLVPSMFSWQFSSGGEVPPGAVEAGVTADGEKLYFGRVTHDGGVTPGKIHPSHGSCYYAFDGEEKASPEYECLVLV
ncbi:uncharacterized protein LOC131851959 [Achroia grisella]|uniref:uncharacterized protein LOC131851959 n=1 Tax=Achroia grisella TaxID=688607 RepID=UPI0027D23AB7|nr:uncharacterized protein LOC131851959 [Achroia grisella]